MTAKQKVTLNIGLTAGAVVLFLMTFGNKPENVKSNMMGSAFLLLAATNFIDGSMSAASA